MAAATGTEDFESVFKLVVWQGERAVKLILIGNGSSEGENDIQFKIEIPMRLKQAYCNNDYFFKLETSNVLNIGTNKILVFQDICEKRPLLYCSLSQEARAEGFEIAKVYAVSLDVASIVLLRTLVHVSKQHKCRVFAQAIIASPIKYEISHENSLQECPIVAQYKRQLNISQDQQQGDTGIGGTGIGGTGIGGTGAGGTGAGGTGTGAGTGGWVMGGGGVMGNGGVMGSDATDNDNEAGNLPPKKRPRIN